MMKTRIVVVQIVVDVLDGQVLLAIRVGMVEWFG